MLLTPHTLVGMAVATSIPNPIIAVPLSLLLHFAGDFMPHWDFFTNTTNKERHKGCVVFPILVDLVMGVIIGLSFMYYAFFKLDSIPLTINMLLCGIFSVLPDALTAPSIYVKNAHPLFKTVHKLQSKIGNSANPPWGIITQLIVAVMSLFLISNSITQL
ncbi:hypothetical protein ACFL13_01810 [Patescibacteria group bacterium]